MKYAIFFDAGKDVASEVRRKFMEVSGAKSEDVQVLTSFDNKYSVFFNR